MKQKKLYCLALILLLMSLFTQAQVVGSRKEQFNSRGNILNNAGYSDGPGFSDQRKIYSKASVPGQGWYRIAQIGQLNGQNTVTVYTIGGSYKPKSTTIRWWHDWSVSGGMNILSEFGENDYWSKARVTDDGVSNSYLEVYFSAQVSDLYLCMQFDGGMARGSLYKGILSQGGGNERISVSTNDISFSDKLVINPINGNVGIGITNPLTKLHIVDPSLVTEWTGDNNQGLRIENDLKTNHFSLIGFGGLSGYSRNLAQIGALFVDSGAYLYFGTSNNPGKGITNSGLVIDPSGKIGVGTKTPLDIFTVRGGISKETTSGTNGTFDNIIKFRSIEAGNSDINKWIGIDATITAGAPDKNKMKFRISQGDNSEPVDVMTLSGSGNVAIGLPDAGTYKLNVMGKIRANEIVVNTEGADFVFDPGYKLPELSVTEKYIKVNQKLPGIPSAMEMQKEGMSLSEMQTKLLQKIEELTLYIIEQNKQNEVQSREIEMLKKELAGFRKKNKE